MPTQTERLNTAVGDRYRVDREIGSGGMATVYLGHDLKHDRDVAIKVLHPDLGAALGAERFLAEIKTTAKLQHPHILPLLESGEADGLLFYVMPLVEGETLRARLTRERQLPIDVALRVATESAGALDYAHRHGVIHRDIKPENILLHDGRAVIADFGIALAVSAASGSRMTQTGLSLGTPQYMSPEQAMGEKQIDARADVYALGAVLYEMLTGEPPFSGATVQAIVAKVLTEKPMHPAAVRDTIPAHVETAVLKALAKLPADRFATAAEFADALARPEATAALRARAASEAHGAADAAFGTRRRLLRNAPLAWGVAALAIVVAAAGWLRGGANTSAALPMIRAEVPIVAGTVPTVIGGGTMFGIANDGSHIAFTGVDSTNVAQIFVQALDAPSITRVPGSDFSTGAFFSPDGKKVGFSRRGRILLVAIGGGTPIDLAPAAGMRGATWGADGTIVVSSEGDLLGVRATGGPVEVLAKHPDARTIYRNPVFADARHVVFDIIDDAGPALAVLSLADHKVTRLGVAGLKPAVLDAGVLAWVSLDAALWAADFDLASGRPTGAPRLVTAGMSLGGLNNPRFAMARNGTTVVMAGTGADDRNLVLMDRSGRSTVIGPGKRAYRYPRFSPDGRKIAFGLSGVRGPGSGDIWTLDLAAGTMLRITSDSASYHPEWAPDGKSTIYPRRPIGGQAGLYRTNVDQSGPAVLIANGQAGIWESSVTPDGKTIVFRMDGTTTMRDIYMITAGDKPDAALPLVKTNFDEYGPAVGPDGKWLAYASNEAGTTEVYVRRLEANSPRWRVSRGGGFEPRWAKNGELFFRNRDSVLVSRIVPGVEPMIGAPAVVFGAKFDASNFEPLWDVSADGKRFVAVRAEGNGGVELYLLLNWVDRWRGTK